MSRREHRPSPKKALKDFNVPKDFKDLNAPKIQ